MGAASDGQANALDRAYEAEAAARKAEAEAAATRAKTGQLEQVRPSAATAITGRAFSVWRTVGQLAPTSAGFLRTRKPCHVLNLGEGNSHPVDLV